MRLNIKEIALLKETLATISTSAKMYLFGSRVDETKRGGDIDLLIIDDNLTKKELRVLRTTFFQKFGEQKIDIVLDNPKLENPFVKYIFPKAIEL